MIDPSSLIGNWPNKGAIMHYHWAKLYLNSYVLRGLPETGGVIPDHFLEIASAAVAAATSIVTLLLEDKDAQEALAYVAHHVHGMIAFAAMFLLKVATRYSSQLFIDRTNFQMLISALARQFKLTVVGKDHLTQRMAEGLEKMADMLHGGQRSKTNENGLLTLQREAARQAAVMDGTTSGGQSGVNDFEAVDTSAFDFNDPALGLGMPFFDFEGTTLTPGEGIWNFSS